MPDQRSSHVPAAAPPSPRSTGVAARRLSQPCRRLGCRQPWPCCPEPCPGPKQAMHTCPPGRRYMVALTEVVVEGVGAVPNLPVVSGLQAAAPPGMRTPGQCTCPRPLAQPLPTLTGGPPSRACSRRAPAPMPRWPWWTVAPPSCTCRPPCTTPSARWSWQRRMRRGSPWTTPPPTAACASWAQPRSRPRRACRP